MRKFITFDWALKRLLRNKANFVVLEGFLSELLRQDVKIDRFLESEGNKEYARDKSNRVDIMCEDGQGRKIIIEVQYERQYSYFYRMLYGTSKAVTEYIDEGQGYEKVTKVYSVNIVYFDLGQGTDYVYHGKTVFRGLHDDDELLLSDKQRALFGGNAPADLMPEYYVLKVNGFNDVARDTLDEWISFLKTGDIPEHATAKGLAEAREKLRVSNLSDDERRDYYRELERQMVENDVMKSKYIDGVDEGIRQGMEAGIRQGMEAGLRQGIKEGEHNEKLKIARSLKGKVPVALIMESTGLTEDEVAAL
ncbi:MAG: Rpn family recombination-promoting nuclease/putative transposase [Prevotella sp.]|nr:Rpn family recombination-promoting nuclease/putative transposase [Prevotella sp.]